MGSERPLIPLFKPYIAPPEELMPALQKTLYSGYIAEGPKVAEFERAFGEYIGNPNCVAVSSCTAALHLALKLAGAEWHYTYTTALTAEPTNLAIKYAGSIPWWVDVHPATGNILCHGDFLKLTVGAIMMVDYGGIPVRMPWDMIHVPIIEDAAHAVGAVRDGQMVGSQADFTCFSFQAIKHMTTADGGMLVCKRQEDVERARRLRWFGINRAEKRERVDIAEIGFKYNMTDVTATMGLVQLKHLPWVLQEHRNNAKYFSRELCGVKIATSVADCDIPSFWFLTLLTPNAEGLRSALNAANIQSTKIHRRNDEHSVFATLRRPLPNLDRFVAQAVHIPCGWWLTDENRERIVEVVNKWSAECT